MLLQLAFFFVVHDFYIYWFHRLQHRSDLFWRTHEAHHSVDDVDWLSGTRSHALEIVINQSIEFLPIVLLGAAPEVALMKATLDAVWGMYIHSNLDVRAGWLQRVLNGPQMHRWHHARDLPMPARISRPSSPFGTGYSAPLICPSTSQQATGSPTRAIPSAGSGPTSYNTRIRCAARKRRPMGDLIGTAVDGTLYWIGPSELRRLRDLKRPRPRERSCWPTHVA